MTERLGRFEMDIIKEMNQNFIQVNDKLEARLNRIDDTILFFMWYCFYSEIHSRTDSADIPVCRNIPVLVG